MEVEGKKVVLKESKLFKKKYYSNGWDFSTIVNIPKIKWVCADTETELKRNNVNVSNDEIYEYYKLCTDIHSRLNLNNFRQDIFVNCWALTIANENNFCIFQCVEDFITAITYMQVDIVVWYNAKFDFTIFDYYFLTNEWKDADDIIKDLKNTKKLPNNTYKSLNGDFSQRYQMQIWKEYTDKSYKKHVHKTTMIDLCNVLGGGLKKNLIDFDVEDNEGNKIRKLDMDYQNADIYSMHDLKYMYNDVVGLYYLTLKFDKICKDISGYSFIEGDFITAGGLAKKSLLKYMFNKSDKMNKRAFKYYFPMTIDLDYELRHNYLYKGGMCIVNEKYKNKIVHNIYKYDVNSMYPAQMEKMLLPFGDPVIYTPEKLEDFKPNHVYILEIKKLQGFLKPNMIPVYMDTLSNDYVSFIQQTDKRYIYLEELQMYEKFYNLSYEIVKILEFKGVESIGMKKFVNHFYNIKSTTKNKSLKQVVKLIINSSYGKLSQRVQNEKITQIMSEYGFVKTEKTKVENVSDSALLSIFLGARVTALGRICLCDYILKITKNNPAKNFIYCDTDSVVSLTKFEDTDDKELGKMKFEGMFANGIFLAPKTYLTQGYDLKYDVHTKGVNTNVVLEECLKYPKFEDVVNNVFKAGVKFKCLMGFNCKGGKALFYVDKTILNDEESNNEELLINHQEEENLQ